MKSVNNHFFFAEVLRLYPPVLVFFFSVSVKPCLCLCVAARSIAGMEIGLPGLNRHFYFIVSV